MKLALRVLILLLAAAPAGLGAQEAGGSVWERAQEAMQHNRLEEAVPLLELSVEQDPSRGNAYRMLAVALEQTGAAEQAAAVLSSALEREAIEPGQRARIAFDLALLNGRQGDPDAAAGMYTRALQLDGALSLAYLNRANAYVNSGSYPDAVRDYEYFLALRPDTAQRANIEQMIALLQESIEAERLAREEAEQRRREEEEARRIAEEEERRRQEEERRRQEEERRQAEARREQMLSSVLESLGTADEEAESFEVENEELRSYDEELDIVD